MRFPGNLSMLVCTLSAGVILAATGICLAAEDVAIEGNIVGPFPYFAIEGRPDQRIFSVSNRTETARTVKLTYAAPQESGAETHYCRTVSLPPKSVRRAEMPVRIGVLTPLSLTEKRGRASKSLPRCQERYILWNAATGRQIWQGFGFVNKILPAAMTLAVMGNSGEKADSYKYLLKLPGRELGNVRPLVQGIVKEPPWRWYGYCLAQTVLLRGAEMSPLQVSQLGAVLEWVGRGGVLVISGSKAMPEMLRGELGAAAGVAAVGVHYVDALSVTKVPKKSLPEVKLHWPAPMVELVAAEASVIFRANGLPLLTRHPVGEGTVFCLSVPAGALADKSLHTIWREVADARRTLAPIGAGNFMAPAAAKGSAPRAPARAALESIAGRRGPGRMVPIMILVALAGLTVAAGVVTWLKRRGELIWIMLVPVGLVTALGLHIYAGMQSDDERLSFIGLITGLGGDAARLQQVFAYYSGPHTQRVNFSAGSPKGLIADIGKTGTAAMMRQEVSFDGVMTLTGQTVERNSTRAFYNDAIRQVGSIVGRLTFGPSGLTGTLENKLGMEISDAVFYVNRRAYRLGDIPATGQTTVTVNADSRLGRGEFTGSVIHKELLGRLANTPGLNKHLRREPVLIGYTSHSPLQPLGERKIQQQGWCVVVWPLELSPAPAGAKVFIPAGFVNLTLRSLVWDPVNERFGQGHGPAELIVTAGVPRQIGRLEQTTAHLNVSIRAPNYRLRISGVQGRTGRSRGRLNPIRTLDRPDGTWNLVIPEADRFRSDDGSYVFSLKVERISGRKKKLPAGSAAAWTFINVDVALEGISR